MTRTVPVGIIIGGVVGGALVTGGLILLALCKTGHIKALKRGGSTGPAVAAGSSASYPARGAPLSDQHVDASREESSSSAA